MNIKRYAGTFILTASLGLGFAIPGAQAADQPKEKVDLLANYSFHGRHAPYFVGIENGYFDDAGFKVNALPAAGSGAVIAAIDSGKADFGMADAAPVVQAVSKGSKVKTFMIYMDRSTMGLASTKPYPDLASLKDARIAASGADSVRVILPIILKMENLQDMPLNWLSADPSVYISLVLSGQADLFTASSDGDVPAFEAVAKKQGKDTHFISFADNGFDAYGYVLIANDKTIQASPDKVKRFYGAMKKAVEFSLENPEKTAEIMLKYNPTLNYDTVLRQWQQASDSINTDYTAKNGYGVITHDRAQATIDMVAEVLHLDKAGLEVEKVFDIQDH
ncbi:ABC transporter substrate-binding protein [Castellaniella sp.]|uniref:ABC transporter substrate-binding protein n=1 Tax=Castellaniella sp. TaxID=1955812 RepID=UPI0035658828